MSEIQNLDKICFALLFFANGVTKDSLGIKAVPLGPNVWQFCTLSVNQLALLECQC